jgi:hypothetical protein
VVGGSSPSGRANVSMFQTGHSTSPGLHDTRAHLDNTFHQSGEDNVTINAWRVVDRSKSSFHRE